MKPPLALAVAIAVAACGSSKREDRTKHREPDPSPLREKQDRLNAQLDAAPATPPGKHWFDVPAEASGAFGQPECKRYMAAVKEYMDCDKIPPGARDAIRVSVEQLADALGQSHDNGAMVAAATACRAGLDAIATGARAMGCTITNIDNPLYIDLEDDE